MVSAIIHHRHSGVDKGDHEHEIFSANHVATLLRYTGARFIAGAAAHGTFSEARAFGILANNDAWALSPI